MIVALPGFFRFMSVLVVIKDGIRAQGEVSRL